MSEPGERRGVFTLATDVVTALPPSFLGLLVVNLAFLAILFLLIDRVQQHRADLIDKLMTTCVQTLEQRR